MLRDQKDFRRNQATSQPRIVPAVPDVMLGGVSIVAKSG